MLQLQPRPARGRRVSPGVCTAKVYRARHRQVACTCSSASAHTRRQALLEAALATGAAACWLLCAPAQAAVTVTLRPKVQLKPYTLKAGFSVTVPDTWGLAYDRSTDGQQGTQVFFGNFRTFETLSILKLPKPEGDQTPQQLLDAVLAEQRNNQSTYDFKLLSGEVPTPRTVDATTFYDSEFLLAICRGIIQEGAGGTRRCIGPRDVDLEVVSRTFYQTFTVQGSDLYVVRGSSTSDKWPDVRAAAEAAVQSFRPGPSS